MTSRYQQPRKAGAGGAAIASGNAAAAALRRVRHNLDRLFDKNLTDLIRGIRNNRDQESRYITACLEEIKKELRHELTFIKANAIAKLCYLQMLGYDISWASFNIIEVMASTKFAEKRIGYLAASQCFYDGTDVLMLATNLIRKHMMSAHVYESGVALGGLACFVTPDLARDLAADALHLLSSSRAYTRKRALLLLYKIFLKYPEALRPSFPKLKDKLEDQDAGVQSAAVNVICELARRNPHNYLPLAPIFFKLMTTSSNNWMLIKIIKLFGALVPLEPRLGKKLLEPLTNLINSTSAMSLLYECITTVIAVLISVSQGAPGDHTASIQLCVSKLGVLIDDADQNLKYLGLLAMGKILATYPKAVQAHKDIVLRCLDDRDESIRLRALDLLYGMVSKRNIQEIITRLMSHVATAEGAHYRDELLTRIIAICSYNSYQFVTDFEWYVSVLVELTNVDGGDGHGRRIAEQLVDVSVRVESIRHLAAGQAALLVENGERLLAAGGPQRRANIAQVLQAAAYIVGEYHEHVPNPTALLEALMKARSSTTPGDVLAVYLLQIGKLWAALVEQAERADDWEAVESVDNLLASKLPLLARVEHLEAQERACALLALVQIAEEAHSKREKIGDELVALNAGELAPVAAKAQRKVPVPQGLDLDAWLGEPWPESDAEAEAVDDEEEEEEEDAEVAEEVREDGKRGKKGKAAAAAAKKDGKKKTTKKTKKGAKKNQEEAEEEEEDEEEKERRRLAWEARIASNPYYVKSSTKNAESVALTAAQKRTTPHQQQSHSTKKKLEAGAAQELTNPLEIPGMLGLSRYMQQQQQTVDWKKKKTAKGAAAKEADGDDGAEPKKSKKTKKGGKKSSSATAVVDSDEDNARPSASTAPTALASSSAVNRGAGEMPDDAKSTDEEEGADLTAKLADQFKALDMELYGGVQPLFQDETNKTAKSKKAKTEEQSESALLGEESTRAEEPASAKKKKTSKKSAKKTTDERKTTDGAKPKLKKKASKKIEEEQPRQFASLAPEGYEEASGLCTPSQPPTRQIGDSSSPELTALGAMDQPGSSRDDESFTADLSSAATLRSLFYQPLAQDDHVKVEFGAQAVCVSSLLVDLLGDDDRPPENRDARVRLCVLVQNVSETEEEEEEVENEEGEGQKKKSNKKKTIDGIRLELTADEEDSTLQVEETDLKEGTSEDDENALSLAPGASHQFTRHVRLQSQASSSPAAKFELRGRLHYHRIGDELEDGSSNSTSLEFRFHLPASALVVAAQLSPDELTSLLQSGTLRHAASTEFVSDVQFQDVLSRLSLHAQLGVVERDDAVASLYAKTLLGGGSLCLLVKKISDARLRIDAKSEPSSAALLDSLLEDVRRICGAE